MPRTAKSKLKPTPISRAQLDAKLAELHSISPRTVRLWRRKGAPFDEPEEMADWIADNCQQGKKDDADVRAARVQKLTLQIEALTLRERDAAGQYISRSHWMRLVEPEAEAVRRFLRETLLTEQPSALAYKSEHDVRTLSTEHYRAFVAKMHAFCREDLRGVAASSAPVVAPVVAAPEPESTEAPKGKRGRTADPEMEALRLRKLNLECQALDRANQVARGDMLPREKYTDLHAEHFGLLRSDIKGRFVNEQPATHSGRSAAEIFEMNRKVYERLTRRLRTCMEHLTDFRALPGGASTQPNPTHDDQP